MTLASNADLAKKSEEELHPHAIDLDFITTEVAGSLLYVFSLMHTMHLLLPLCPRFRKKLITPAGGICAQKVNYHIAIIRFSTHSKIIIANSRY